MLVLVSYDVNTQDAAGRRRLRRIARHCENWGQRVQFSVFECLVDPAQWVALRANLVECMVARTSLPARERGLKPFVVSFSPLDHKSLPARERGLKRCRTGSVHPPHPSLPARDKAGGRTWVPIGYQKEKGPTEFLP